MILVKPSAAIEIITPNALQVIEAAGRTCYKSEGKTTANSAYGFVRMLLKRGHESVLEHASASVRFICDRGVSHELVRHRVASYSQESTRYCDYEGGHVAFVIPQWCDIRPGLHNEESLNLADGSLDAKSWAHIMLDSEAAYKALRKVFNWRPEQARSVLPNSLKTELVMTANFREWRLFFKLRCAPAAHSQMREVALPLLDAMKAAVPIVFDDLQFEKEICPT